MKVAFDQISDFAQFVSADYSNNSSCQPQDQSEVDRRFAYKMDGRPAGPSLKKLGISRSRTKYSLLYS